MKRVDNIKIDLKSKEYRELTLKQMDTTQLIFNINENGSPIELEGLIANLIFTKPNGTVVIQAANIDSEKKVIIADLLKDCVRDYGKGNIEIELIEGENVVSSFQLVCKIEKTGKDFTPSTNNDNYYEKNEKILKEIEKKLKDGDFIGETGATGNGISNIEKIKTEGLIDTYQINFTNGTSTTYQITNGINRIREWGVRYYYNQSSSKLERLGDAIGMTANATKNGAAVVNDFDYEELFKEIKEVKRDKTTHKLLAVKGDADYDSIDGEIMIDFPDTYWKIEEASDKTYLDIWLSNVQKAGYFKVDKFSVGKYSLSLADDGTLQTKSGFPVEGNKGITTWRNLVKEQYGEGACLMDWRYSVITYLYLIEFADFNSQSVLGNGLHSFRYNASTDKALIAETGVNRIIINTSGGNAFVVGQRIMIGTWDGGNNIAAKRKVTSKESYTSEDGTITGVAVYFDGDAVDITTSCILMTCGQDTGSADDIQASSGCMSNDGRHGCSYRGFERNSIYDWIDGISIKDGVIYECTDPTAYASEVFDAPYEALDGYAIPTDLKNGYIKTLGFDKNHPFCRLPKALGGGSSTYITDYCWCNPSGRFAARVGGPPSIGASAGLFYWNLYDAASHASWNCGARVLMYQI